MASMKKVSPHSKVLLIIVVLYFAYPLFIISFNSPSTSYRNLFFYADIYPAKQIIAQGHIPTADLGAVVNGQNTGNYWGKIYNRVNLPMYPVMLAMYSEITGESLTTYYSFFPGYILVAFIYGLIIYRLTKNRSSAVVGGIIGGIAPNIPTAQMVSISSFRIYVVLLCAVLIMYIWTQDRDRIVLLSSIIMLPVFLVWVFFWYPPNFAVLCIILCFGLVASAYSSSKSVYPFLPPLAVGLMLFLQIFSIPLGSYINYFTQAAIGILSGELIIPTSTSTRNYPTAMDTFGYNVIPVVSILIPAAIGGLLSFREVYRHFNSSVSNQNMVFLSIWGSGVFCFTLFYFATGESFLVTRPLNQALPIMIVASVVTLSKIRGISSVSVIPVIVAVIIIISSFCGALYLQSNVPQRTLHSYQSGYEDSANWMSHYGKGVVISDMKTGAMLVINGYYKTVHPQKYSEFRGLYYGTDDRGFKKVVEKYNGKYVVLNTQMANVGIYAIGTAHRPMSNTEFQYKQDNSDKIYTNGAGMFVYSG